MLAPRLLAGCRNLDSDPACISFHEHDHGLLALRSVIEKQLDALRKYIWPGFHKQLLNLLRRCFCKGVFQLMLLILLLGMGFGIGLSVRPRG